MEFAVFQFDLIAKDELHLPLYKGSAFRGLFGHALKKTSCVTNKLDCNDCMLRAHCAYAYIFETLNDRGEKVAHPFVLEPPMLERSIFPPGDILKVNLILFGRAIDYLPYIVYTFREMGNRGIGSKRGKFWLQRVSTRGNTIYDVQEQRVHTNFERQDIFQLPDKSKSTNPIIIRFLTPTALKVNGAVSKDISFLIFVKAIIRRLKALSVYHNGKSDFKMDEDIACAEDIKAISKLLEPYTWKRYSSRQSKSIQFDGFIGSVEFEGDIEPYMQLLRIGEIIHIGRGTVYGMGKYQIEIK